jgi:lysophospholipase
LTKLSFLLALPGLGYKDIVMQMELSIRGEMTEVANTQFSHPETDAPIITARQTAFTALGHAITTGSLSRVLAILTSDPHNLLEAKDYAENTALHLAGRSSFFHNLCMN